MKTSLQDRIVHFINMPKMVGNYLLLYLLEIPGGPKPDADGGASVAFLILQPPRPLLATPPRGAGGGGPRPPDLDLSVSGLI